MKSYYKIQKIKYWKRAVSKKIQLFKFIPENFVVKYTVENNIVRKIL